MKMNKHCIIIVRYFNEWNSRISLFASNISHLMNATAWLSSFGEVKTEKTLSEDSKITFLKHFRKLINFNLNWGVGGCWTPKSSQKELMKRRWCGRWSSEQRLNNEFAIYEFTSTMWTWHCFIFVYLKCSGMTWRNSVPPQLFL